jgi:hypothetical protein
MMETLFTWIEGTGLSTWLRDSPSLFAFPFVLILHTVGLAFLVGTNVTIDARLLGWAAAIPPRTLTSYFRVMWIGFWINAVSGVLLLIAYPTKALTNPLFYVKLTLIGAGLAATRPIRAYLHDADSAADEATPRWLRTTAILSLACWAASIAAGRLLAYTYSRLTVDFTP